MVITGAFQLDGGIAAVNRLVIAAVAKYAQSNDTLEVLALLETETTVDVRYVGLSQVRYRCFGGQRASFVLAAWQCVLRDRYDWVYFDLVNLAALLSPVAWLRICRTIVWLHGIEVLPPRPNWEGLLGLKSAWKRLASSTTTCERVLERFPQLTAMACELALDPVKYGVELPVWGDYATKSITLQSVDGTRHALKAQVVLHVGRMAAGEQYKGQDVLIRAMPDILTACPDAQLVLVGQGDDRSRLLELARSLPDKMQSAVFLPGYVPDEELNGLYQQCAVFAMPSRGEGFGLVYLEAMRWAKPCIGSRVDGAQSVIQHEQTGLLVDDPTSSQEVGEAVKLLLLDKGLAARYGRAGYELVGEHYLFPHFAKRFWQAVEDRDTKRPRS